MHNRMMASGATRTAAKRKERRMRIGIIGSGNIGGHCREAVFAMVQYPSIYAAVSALPERHGGVGLGIYQMLFVLGGGFGPAVSASLLASRQSTGPGAINPLFGAGSAAYSDALLMLTLAMVAALLMTLLTISKASKRDTA